MSKNQIKYLAILLFGIALFVVAEMYIQEPIDWRMTFNKKDKIPYGTYILYDILPDLFPSEEIKINEKSFYEFNNTKDSTQSYNYFIINKYLDIDNASNLALLDFVSQGNDVFIIANDFSQNIKDSLKINIIMHNLMNMQKGDTTSVIKLVNPKINKNSGYFFVNKLFRMRLETNDKTNFTILGLGEDLKPNFVKISHGKGNFFINLQPLAFTNFHILNSQNYYFSNALSYLKNRTIIWDEYYKPYRAMSQTPMRYFISRPALKFAFYLFMFVMLLYLIFQYKREQRLIPVIHPPKNHSANFVKTIGQLHFLKKDYNTISKQIINLFLEKIRDKYFIKTNNINDAFYKQLAAKSTKTIEQIKELFEYILLIKSKQNITEKELIKLNSLIEDFC